MVWISNHIKFIYGDIIIHPCPNFNGSLPKPPLEVWAWMSNYRQVSNISCTLVGNKIVDHSEVVGASPVGAAPTTSSFWT